MPKKIKAEMSVRPTFDAAAVADLSGGIVYPAMKSSWTLSSGTSKLDSKIFGETTKTYIAGLSPLTVPSGKTGTYKSWTTFGSGSSVITGTGPWTFTYDEISDLTKEQQEMVLDVVCNEIARR